MKRMNRKSVLLVLSVVLLLTATVGGTLAYLIDMDGPVTNIFDPIHPIPPMR